MRNPNPRTHRSNPYRSQLCQLFQKGKCYYGENCRYAHSIGDLTNLGFDIFAAERHENEDNKRNGACEIRRFWSFNGKLCPYRTQMCMLFQKGKCYYGENCHYAHSISDLGNLGFDTFAAERHQNEDNKRNGTYETRPCFWSFNGKHCPYGERCHFLHKYDHMDVRNECLQKKSFAISVANVGKDNSASEHYRVLNTDEDQRRVSFYKTRLCAKWESFGRCPYGVKCTYAHGDTELETHTKKLQVRGHSCMKWSVEKIGRIYADWIDSTHEVQSPSS